MDYILLYYVLKMYNKPFGRGVCVQTKKKLYAHAYPVHTYNMLWQEPINHRQN